MDNKTKHKVCGHCKEEKPHEDYYIYTRTINNRQYRNPNSYCKQCASKTSVARRMADREHYRKTQKAWYIKNKENVSIYKKTLYLKIKSDPYKHAEWNRKKRQEHLKRAYGIDQEYYELLYREQKGLCAICNGLPGERKLHVDHDHETGKLRGLLCTKCNTFLGKIERTQFLKEYLIYLKKQRSDNAICGIMNATTGISTTTD